FCNSFSMSGSQRLEPKCTLDRLLSQGYSCPNSLRNGTGNFRSHNREFFRDNREFNRASVSVHCSHACFAPARRDLFSLAFLQSQEEQMADRVWSRERYGEAFWRAHHEAWRQSDLNQREYCEAQGLSLKAFGNWRAKF